MVIDLKTPLDPWNGKPIDYSSLHVFGCPTYVMYKSQERTKLDLKFKRWISCETSDKRICLERRY